MDDITHVCLFPEFFSEAGPMGGYIGFKVYDHEAEIEDRRLVGKLVRDPHSDTHPFAWVVVAYLTYPQYPGYKPTEHEVTIGYYPYIAQALRDLAYAHGQYWSPNR